MFFKVNFHQKYKYQFNILIDTKPEKHKYPAATAKVTFT